MNDLKKFSHIDDKNQPKMVNVSEKAVSRRRAVAFAQMYLGTELISLLDREELHTKKGPVFQTAIIAGIQAVKKTPDLIPMCHPLLLEGIEVQIRIADKDHIEITCAVEMEGKTGVEMEALTGVSAAALTVYDMCKAISQKMVIREIRLLEKTGGKSDIQNS